MIEPRPSARPGRGRRLLGELVVPALLLLVPGGCGTRSDHPGIGTADGPDRVVEALHLALDPERSTERRIDAMDELERIAPDDAARIQVLKYALVAPEEPLAWRVAAWEDLLAHDEALARETLRYRLPSIDEIRFLEHVTGVIAEQGWVEMTPALVRSLARTSSATGQDDERPEWAALAALHPDRDVEETVLDFVAGPADDPLLRRWRMSGWVLLARTLEPDELRAVLADVRPIGSDHFLHDLRRAADEVGVLPRRRDEIDWIVALLEPDHAERWARYVEVGRDLAPDQRDVLRVRDLAVLRHVADLHPEWLAWDDVTLWERAEARFATRPTRYVNRGWESVIPSPREPRLPDEATRFDALAVLLADRLLQRPATRLALFDHAMEDREDDTTEYGGIIDVDPPTGDVLVLRFSPVEREDDRTFLVSDAMLDRGRLGTFQYHFHAQHDHNEEYAGPGPGDLRAADFMTTSNLVLTTVDEDVFNVDWYRDDGVFVDLGLYERP